MARRIAGEAGEGRRSRKAPKTVRCDRSNRPDRRKGPKWQIGGPPACLRRDAGRHPSSRTASPQAIGRQGISQMQESRIWVHAKARRTRRVTAGRPEAFRSCRRTEAVVGGSALRLSLRAFAPSRETSERSTATRRGRLGAKRDRRGLGGRSGRNGGWHKKRPAPAQTPRKRKTGPVLPPAPLSGSGRSLATPDGSQLSLFEASSDRVSIRVQSKRTSTDPFAVPLPESSGSAGLRWKWVRLWVAPPPRASPPAAPPLLFRLRSRRTSAASAVAALRSFRPLRGGRS